MSNLDWKFDLQGGQASRLSNLQTTVQFIEIAKRIAENMTVLCGHRDDSRTIGSFVTRAVYCIQLECELFDLFFNSASGYRAAYFRSPGEGIEANRTFSKLITSKLVDSSLSSDSGLGSKFVEESLLTPSAKVWLVENKEVEKGCLVVISPLGRWRV